MIKLQGERAKLFTSLVKMNKKVYEFVVNQTLKISEESNLYFKYIYSMKNKSLYNKTICVTVIGIPAFCTLCPLHKNTESFLVIFDEIREYREGNLR